MENPVCALVEKQFVTFPGAAELQLIGRIFTYAGRAGGAAQTWGDGHGPRGHPRLRGLSKVAPMCPALYGRTPSSQACHVLGAGKDAFHTPSPLLSPLPWKKTWGSQGGSDLSVAYRLGKAQAAQAACQSHGHTPLQQVAD